MARVLVVDDEEGLRSFVAEALETDGHDVTQADSAETALEALAKRTFDLVITDLKMPGMGGIELIRAAATDQPELQFIVITAHGNVETAVEAMRLGAFDYLQKPVSGPAELRIMATRALERRELGDARDRAAVTSQKGPSLGYGDPAMEAVVVHLGKVAPTNATVLLMGESGTGKEVAARAVHDLSGRRHGPFVAVNCATLSADLLASELFGHEKGSFTGAASRKRGRIELAHGGTFLLDEVGELEPGLQAKLLRVIQEKTFERVGGTQPIEVDVRWIAATNRDLRAQMDTGAFREDLYHRLSVFPVSLPALRDRPRDIAPLSTALLERIARDLKRPRLSLDRGARAALAAASWPGNIRELANVLERAAILADGDVISADQLLIEPGRAPTDSAPHPPRTLEDLEPPSSSASAFARCTRRSRNTGST